MQTTLLNSNMRNNNRDHSIDAEDTVFHNTAICADSNCNALALPAALFFASSIRHIVYGAAAGVVFYLTSFSAILTLISKNAISIPLGIITGVTDGITSGIINYRATRQLFTFRPDIWLAVPLVFTSVGGLAALPLVAAALQSIDVISNKIGVDITFLKPIVGNTALATYGTLMSIGLVNLFANLMAFIRWKAFNNEHFKHYQMRRYLENFRSESEYQDFIDNPDNFLARQYSPYHIFLTLISLAIAFGFSYEVAGEIPNAINAQSDVWLMKSINVFGLVDINDFAKTSFGSKAISCVTGGPLYSIFILISLRVLPRDIKFLLESIAKKNISASMKVVLYLLYTLMTCMTAIFESIKGGASLSGNLVTLLGIYLLNYSGSRALIFNQFYSKCAQLFESFKIQRHFNEPQISFNSQLFQSNRNSVPTPSEREESLQHEALMRLDELENSRYSCSMSGSTV
ncbi:MAG: hypothetical protein A3F17_08705 [Gammaproteobacteria bacterium RIFCSPHIGHO2_12_FULL_41_15]|nr:MAG: hypothetical protein A3F17_08705 [Gammaproteobacteria bacterium RIFCSPHIGHO2_12_FULL_41_15]